MKNKLFFPLVALTILVVGILDSRGVFANATDGESENKNTNIVTLKTDTFAEVTGKGLVFVDFWAPWCGPCRKMNPILNELATEYAETVTIAKFNVDSDKQFSIDKGISSIPAIIVYKDGKEVDRIIGVVSKSYLAKVIAHYSAKPVQKQ